MVSLPPCIGARLPPARPANGLGASNVCLDRCPRRLTPCRVLIVVDERRFRQGGSRSATRRESEQAEPRRLAHFKTFGAPLRRSERPVHDETVRLQCMRPGARGVVADSPPFILAFPAETLRG